MKSRLYHFPGKVAGVAACGKPYGSAKSRVTTDRSEVTCPKCVKVTSNDGSGEHGHAARMLDWFQELNGLGRGRYVLPKRKLPYKTHRWLLRNRADRATTAVFVALNTELRVSEAKQRLCLLLDYGLVRKIRSGYIAVNAE